MSNILEKGDIIKKIRDGVDLDEIMSYARNSLYKDGPTDTIVLEILSYIKIFHTDYFKDYENDIVATMGLYFKNPVPESLEGLIFDLYNQHIQEKWGETYTPVQANISQALYLKGISQAGVLDETEVYKVISEEKANQKEHIRFSKDELRRFFPGGYSSKQMSDAIIKMLEARQRARENKGGDAR